jgi:hypothetical protein
MPEFTEALAESYAEQLQKWLKIEVALSGAALILLYWAAEMGGYNSALLSLAHASAKSLTDENAGIFELPIFVFAGSLSISFLIGYLYDRAARGYFQFVLQTPRIENLMANMREDQIQIQRAQHAAAIADLRDAQRELAIRRERVQLRIKWSKGLFMAASVLALSSIKGNALDLLVAALAVFGAAYLLHWSVGRFIAEVGPRLALVLGVERSILQGTQP